MKSKAGRGVLVGLAAAAFAFALHLTGVLEPLEGKSWDARLRLLARPSDASSDIVLVHIDQPSLDFFEKQQAVAWPWPRQIYAAVADYLKAGGARAVFFDLILSETSAYGVEDDAEFARAIERAGNVFLPVFLSKTEDESGGRAAVLLEKHVLRESGLPARAIHSLRSVSLPVEGFLGAARGVGNVQFEMDGDSIYRRLPLAFSYGVLVLPSLPAALVEFVKGTADLKNVPLDLKGNMILRYHGPAATYKSYAIAALVNSWAQIEAGQTPQVPPSEFAGKIVVVGASAPGLLDLRPSPFGGAYAGMEILATGIDNLLNRDFVRTAGRAVTALIALLVAIATGVGTSLLRRTRNQAAFFALLLAVPIGAAAGGFKAGWWLDMTTPLLAVLASFIAASLLNYSLEGRQKRFLKNAFRYYLSPDVIERVIENPDLLKLGGTRRTITAFFSDVAGFTTISEGLSPEDLVGLLNAYLSEMTDIILDTGGTLDKYEGDAIIAFWNAPLDEPDHAVRACRAALRCQRRLAELKGGFRDKYGHEVAMRIGLNSGPVVVGNMGSMRRFDYTAMGDAMNLASRLEGASKIYKTSVLAGEVTEALAREAMIFREVDVIRVVGKKKPVHVFELVGERGDAPAGTLERVELFHRGLGAYRAKDWKGALDIFRSLEGDHLAALYAGRSEAFLASPPAEDWDGVFELKHK
jgi:adenylate cyclase